MLPPVLPPQAATGLLLFELSEAYEKPCEGLAITQIAFSQIGRAHVALKGIGTRLQMSVYNLRGNAVFFVVNSQIF